MSSYISGPYAPESIGDCVDWRLRTWDRLAFLYGPERADRIQAGQDPATQIDLYRWQSLGRRRVA